MGTIWPHRARSSYFGGRRLNEINPDKGWPRRRSRRQTGVFRARLWRGSSVIAGSLLDATLTLVRRALGERRSQDRRLTVGNAPDSHRPRCRRRLLPRCRPRASQDRDFLAGAPQRQAWLARRTNGIGGGAGRRRPGRAKNTTSASSCQPNDSAELQGWQRCTVVARSIRRSRPNSTRRPLRRPTSNMSRGRAKDRIDRMRPDHRIAVGSVLVVPLSLRSWAVADTPTRRSALRRRPPYTFRPARRARARVVGSGLGDATGTARSSPSKEAAVELAQTAGGDFVFRSLPTLLRSTSATPAHQPRAAAERQERPSARQHVSHAYPPFDWQTARARNLSSEDER